MADGEESATDDSASGGTYSLLLNLPEDATIEVGALGELAFDAGSYVYTGSAFGPGGFTRIDRHREIATGGRDVRHWHVDYLLGHPKSSIEAVWISPGNDRECAIAAGLPGEPIPEFGASDCDCEAHLVAGPTEESAPEDGLQAALASLHESRYD